LFLECESPPLREDKTGAIRIGDSRVLLELMIRAFQDGVSPETIVKDTQQFLYLTFTSRSVIIFGISKK